MTNTLIIKYNIAGPRYTSYPTVPFWNTKQFTEMACLQRLDAAFAASNATTGISLYIHLLYCESLCTFCGCNRRITIYLHGVRCLFNKGRAHSAVVFTNGLGTYKSLRRKARTAAQRGSAAQSSRMARA